MGLANVERRLAAHYGRAGSLSIASTPGIGTVVEVRLPAERKALATVVPLSAGSRNAL